MNFFSRSTIRGCFHPWLIFIGSAWVIYRPPTWLTWVKLQDSAEALRLRVPSKFSLIFNRPNSSSIIACTQSQLQTLICSHSNLKAWRISSWPAIKSIGPWPSWRPSSPSSQTWPTWTWQLRAWLTTTMNRYLLKQIKVSFCSAYTRGSQPGVLALLGARERFHNNDILGRCVCLEGPWATWKGWEPLVYTNIIKILCFETF